MVTEYNPCICVQNLSYEEQEAEQLRAIKGWVEVDTKYSKIIFFSELKDARIGFNNICTYVKKGITYVCMCSIRALPFESKINLTSDFLSVISQIPCEIPDTAAFYIRGRNHLATCKYTAVPSLKKMSYLALLLKGYGNTDFEYFKNNMILPRELLKERPRGFGQIIYCLPNHLVHMFPLLPTQYVLSCEKPDLHLFSYVH
jgi:hypothetical protein